MRLSSKEDIIVKRSGWKGGLEWEIYAHGHLDSPSWWLTQPLKLLLQCPNHEARYTKHVRVPKNTDTAGIQGRGQNAYETYRENAPGRKPGGMCCRLSTWPRTCPSVPGTIAGLWGRVIAPDPSLLPHQPLLYPPHAQALTVPLRQPSS